jgi:diguanylate cyclase (GGDEF)-like protein
MVSIKARNPLEMLTAALASANQQLHFMATHDTLTSLPNRAHFEHRVDEAIADAGRGAGPFALVVLNLDRFKVVNDALGRRMGDELLRIVARRLRGVLRASDLLARLEGNTFAALVSPVRSAGEALRGARKLLLALHAPVRLEGTDVHPSASIGVACFPNEGVTGEALFARADAAMYAAKERGRHIRLFEPCMDRLGSGRMQLEADLHRALKQRQFELYYQPKIGNDCARFCGAEALLRWRHPTRGLLAPGEFIPLAEECGLIVRLGDWVLHESCRQLSAWRTAGLSSVQIAVNASAEQFQERDLTSIVEHALLEHGIAGHDLEIEITESAVMRSPEATVDTLEGLKRLGVSIALDDFGTGYSSMGYLRRFSLDRLKIDRSFTADITTSPRATAVLQGIIALAHELHLEVIAEGVETAEQAAVLKGLGCDQYQGYFFGVPLPADDFARLLRHQCP